MTTIHPVRAMRGRYGGGDRHQLTGRTGRILAAIYQSSRSGLLYQPRQQRLVIVAVSRQPDVSLC